MGFENENSELQTNYERLSSVNKVEGGTEEEQKKVSDNLDEEFLTEKLYKNEEREKTPEEKEIINAVITELNDFLSKYDAKPLNLKDTHIHILDKSKMSEKSIDYFEKYCQTSSGYYQQENQDVIVLGWKIISPLELARVISHELIHFLSFNSVVIDKKNKDGFTLHRVGLAVQPQHEEIQPSGPKYFNEINEAVTEELVKRFYDRLKNIPLLTEEYEDLIKTREKYSVPDLAAISMEEVDTPDGIVYKANIKKYAYPKLRKNLNAFIKDIYEKRQNDFDSEEEIFEIFVKAAMTGDVKELATLVDSTLGSGTFKKIAQPND